MADANPGIIGLPTATFLTPDEVRNGAQVPPSRKPRPSATPSRQAPAAPAAPAGGPARVPVSWRSGDAQPPPNLGPPPERLDWRKRPG